MKENRKKNSQKDQQLNTGNESRDISSKSKAGHPSKGDTPGQSGNLNIPEKKVISHRTGDATNFGDRSYQED